jgi:hypothetical protein
MTRKALVVAPGDYGKVAPRLESTVEESKRWAGLLAGVYQYDPVNIRRRNDKPTRESVLDDLNWLLAGAKAGDQLTYVHLGHGSMLQARDRTGKPTGVLEEGLVLYRDKPDIEAATLSSTDFVKKIREQRVPPGVAFSMVIESCFAGRLDVRPSDGKALFVANDAVRPGMPVKKGGPSRVTSKPAAGHFVLHPTAPGSKASPEPHIHQFASIHHPKPADLEVGWPIIVAASGPSEAAYELPKPPRLLFSRRALDELARNGDVSYDGLIQRLTPLDPGFRQQPMLTGDLTRRTRRFLA